MLQSTELQRVGHDLATEQLVTQTPSLLIAGTGTTSASPASLLGFQLTLFSTGPSSTINQTTCSGRGPHTLSYLDALLSGRLKEAVTFSNNSKLRNVYSEDVKRKWIS